MVTQGNIGEEWPGRRRTAGPVRAAGRRRRVPGAARIRTRELPVFSRMIAAMLEAGIPLVEALGALEEQTTSKAFRAVLGGVRSRIESGEDFSTALAEYPDVFDNLYIHMMRAGEAGGMLAETAARLSRYLESAARLRRRVRAAMIYPIVVMILALGIATAMLIWLVPVFGDIYSDFGAQLPGATRVLVAASDFLRRYFLGVAVALAILVVAFFRLKRTEAGGYAWDRFVLRMPLVGELAAKICLGRLSSTFAQLMHGGVPILEALGIVAYAAGNRVYGRIILEARKTVEAGDPLSQELARHRVFPRMLVHMLVAGEKTGRMDEMLQKVAEFYEDEVEVALAGLTSIIEPLLMIFLGIVVGSIVVGMFLPIFRFADILAI